MLLLRCYLNSFRCTIIFVLIPFFLQCQSFILTCRRPSPSASKRTLAASTLSSLHSEDVKNNIENKDNHADKVIAIVGAGVGGLAIASRIASSPDLPKSTKVVVLEKNLPEMVGGRCGSFQKIVPGLGTFRFERGPSLLLLKNVYLDLFRDCGKDGPEDYGINIVQCYPAYKVVFEDGDSIQLGFPKMMDFQCNSNKEKMQEVSIQKMNKYEPDGAQKWDEYMRATEAFLDCGLPNFIEGSLDLASFPSFINEATKNGFKSWPLKPHSDVLDDTFSSNKMKALASFQDLYVGLEPYKNDIQIGGGVMKKTAPAVFGLLAALELHPTNEKAGVFAPIGGFQKISEAFERLALDSGVEIIYNSNVNGISSEGIFYDNNDSKGATKFLSADVIIVNADLPYSKKTLVKNNPSKRPLIARYDWDDKYDFSSGVIAFYWAVNKRCDLLNTHNVFLVSDSRTNIEKSWSAIRFNDPEACSFDNKNFPCNFYVHRSSAMDKSAAPKGCDSLMILVPCCTLKHDKILADLPKEDCIKGYTEQFDRDLIAKVKKVVLHRLSALDGLENLESNIVYESVETPATYAENYNLAAGTPFALSHGFEQLSLTRPGHQCSELDNVLYVGASTRPGNGVPLVLLGAKQVANKVLSKIKKMKLN